MIKKIVAIITGSFFIAVGINYFVIPHHLLDGGIIGLGLIGKYAFSLQPGLTIILLSIPLYMIAFFYNRRYFYNGIHGLLISSFFIDLLRPLSLFEEMPMLISSLTGGLLIGTGVGLMLLTETSTGGLDLLALILSKITAINVGVFIFIIDGIVLLFGWIVISEVTIIYSSLMVFMVGLTTSTITRAGTV
ncbi:YitT family protein [Virgibacillus sp. NKC19-16]|uniref:YitT family protein n=1 Tax=Virgibacillus salidurans TaxID=2831673 RepID=UPI001F35A74D|nr:YitT family protein [Virgibacillus sp. NKC19-16]UJL45222.1 YitT family protein [Virgibacillus sp. NKC19-16]